MLTEIANQKPEAHTGLVQKLLLAKKTVQEYQDAQNRETGEKKKKINTNTEENI